MDSHSVHFNRIFPHEFAKKKYVAEAVTLLCITIAYLRQVDLEEKASLQEKTAWEELQEGTEQAIAVPELLKKLDRPNGINLYYRGGLELLSQAIKDCKFTWLIQSPLFF